jgi:hypothetical protein
MSIFILQVKTMIQEELQLIRISSESHAVAKAVSINTAFIFN